MSEVPVQFAPDPVGMRSAYCGTLRSDDIGRTVTVCGWVGRRREHGEHLAFLDVRDHTGVLQCVVDGAHSLRSEYVVAVTGLVRRRPTGMENDQLATGEVELGDCEVIVLAEAEPPPFSLDGRNDAEESVRLRYRFIDLRSERMQANLRLRARVNAALRSSMDRQGFTELETPLLWTPTPEGAREFAVPSRLQHGSFYVLPQSPQIAKQLSMVGGFDRYYQIARCMRDEDLRADRQFEFTQLDVEASFVTEEDILRFVSVAISDATEAVTGERSSEIVQMTWDEALDRYGTDKPDLRFGMELIDVGYVFENTEFKAFQADTVKAIVLAGGGDSPRSRLDGLVDRAKALGAKGLVWMRVIAGGDGVELESPIVKFLSDEEKIGLVVQTSAVAGDLLLIVADEHRLACEVLGQLRVDLARPPVSEGPNRFCWVIDFPMFDGLDEAGNPQAKHHPFTMPKAEHLGFLESDPLRVRAQSYDLVMNGWELGSGSIRIHRRDIQAAVFRALGITDEEAEARFGFLLSAFRYGAPPHGGFAVGLDRFVAVLCGEENIREVIAFPKTQSGSDLMTGAPLPLTARQLADLGIRVVVPPAVGVAGAR
jgi:aspartyl-tRNA synthetase